MSNTVTLTGWKEFEDKCKGLPAVLTKEINSEVGAAAEYWQKLAINDSPIDQKFLRGLISAKITGNMTAEVTSPSQYSSFMEWGTKSKKKIPAELSSYASTLTYNKTGDYYAFLKAILEWVERKGIASRFSVKTKSKLKHTKADNERIVQAAEAIAFSIMRHGVNPHPFFFIQMPVVEAKLIERVKTILTTEH